ncbi:MAG: MMPL family transporter [Gammaproteobacteria bacterium]|nr:MMPL family transporter [Gammaproteobacteria bacterium]MDH5630009.1 MMPL family transporter [Gammaproteobacteria bacterium]
MDKLSNFVLARKWFVILLTTFFVAIATHGAFNLFTGQFLLDFKSDYRTFFDEDNSQLNDYVNLQNIYSKSENVAIIVAPENGNIFTEKNLTAIWELTDAAWQMTYSSRVDSITNFQHIESEEDDLNIESLLLEADMLDEEKIAKIRDVSLNEPLLIKKLVAENGDSAVVNVTITMPGINQTSEVPEVTESARAIVAEFKQKYPDINFMLSGIVIMNNSFPEASAHDSSILVPTMFMVVFIFIFGLLRSLTGTIATFVVIIFSILTAIGIWGWSGGYLTSPTASAPVVILTLAVADCIHILSTFYYNLRHGMEKSAAMKDSLRVNFQPIFLTSITTAIGFLTMNFSDSPPFGHLGNLVSIGVMAAFVFSITIFPAILMLLPTKAKQTVEHKRDMMDKLADFVIFNRKWLLPVTTVIIVVLASFVPKNELNDDFVKYFDESVPFRQATDFMKDHLAGMTTIELSFDSKQSNGINDPAFLKFVDDFAVWLRQQEETDNVNTVTDTLKRLNKNMHGDDPDWYILPDNRELAAQYLLLYELSLPQGLDVNNQLNVDKSSTRVVATFRNLTSNEVLRVENKISDYFKQHESPYGLTMASPSLMFAHIGSTNIVGMLQGSALALFLISLLLGIALRSVKFGLISLLPNMMPAAISFGLWGILDGEIGLGLSVVAGMTLGIIVDDTVHFLSKYIRARREKGLSSEEAVRYSFASVGKALWVTTMVLVAGFMVMASSSFKVNADMGFLTGVTILIALIVDFLFLPPLLMKLKSKKDKLQQKAQQAVE